MREDIKINARPEDEIINAVIEREWFMFDKVQNIGGCRASCQDDEWTFYVNRYSQFAALSQETVFSYYNDLTRALEEGRNVITEKYAYMMEYTDSEYYHRELEAALPAVPPEKMELVQQIVDIQLRQEKDFREHYPYFAGRGRVLDNDESSFTSFKVYSIGELKTYSYDTLKLFLRDIKLTDSPAELSLSYKIHLNTARFYGHKTLEDAETALREGRR